MSIRWRIALKYCDGIDFTNVRCTDGTGPQYSLGESHYNVVRDEKSLTL